MGEATAFLVGTNGSRSGSPVAESAHAKRSSDAIEDIRHAEERHESGALRVNATAFGRKQVPGISQIPDICETLDEGRGTWSKVDGFVQRKGIRLSAGHFPSCGED